MTSAAFPVAGPAQDLDADLVAAARDGDQGAFSSLYRRHASSVYSRLTRLVGPVPEREDLLQQVFLELHRSLPSFRGDSTLGTYLGRIAAHVAFGYLRHRRRKHTVPLEPEQLADLVAPGVAPDEAARGRENLRQLFEMLGRLKPKKRLAFVLVAVEGLTLSEAAVQLDATQDAVKQRVLAARHELEGMLSRARRKDVEAE
jgi:RNA polymerase sigma-70 factor, ECF subfamily